MIKDEIAYKTYLITFDNQKDLCKTMLRFQEHYESPEFAGCIFSLNEFKDWYRDEYGQFSYYNDWDGFNIPGYILKPFYDGKFKNITNREQKFLDLFLDNNMDFYIIAINKEDPQPYFHELMHAMYYHRKEYRKNVNKIVDKYKNTNYVKKLMKHLKKIGYTKDVIYDEINAYTVCDEDLIEIKCPGKMGKDLKNLSEKSMKNFTNK